MGTWGSGPFDSDMAADFVDGVRAEADRSVALVRGVLTRVRDGHGRYEGAEAVAAAAMVASQCPGGDIYADDAPLGPSVDPENLPPALPVFPIELRALASEALDVVLRGDCDISQDWLDPSDASQWHDGVLGIRTVLGIES